MSTTALFERLRRLLETSGMPYMLTGSYVSAVHGTPRATQDIDIVIEPSRAQELARRRALEVDGVPLLVASAEDAVIAKLEWAKLGASTRQLEDVAGIVRMQGEQLDRTYVERWVAELGLSPQWSEALIKAS